MITQLIETLSMQHEQRLALERLRHEEQMAEFCKRYELEMGEMRTRTLALQKEWEKMRQSQVHSTGSPTPRPIRPAPFNGLSDGKPHIAQRFLDSVDNYVASTSSAPSGAERNHFATSLLEGQAQTWLRSERTLDLRSWPEFREAFLSRWKDGNIRLQALEQLLSLRQTSILPSYATTFEQYMQQVDPRVSAGIQHDLFILGLRPEVRDAMMNLDLSPTITPYDALKALAIRFDLALPWQHQSAAPVPASLPATPAIPLPPPFLVSSEPVLRDAPSAQPTDPDERRKYRADRGLCFYCGGAGHRRLECPSRGPRR